MNFSHFRKCLLLILTLQYGALSGSFLYAEEKSVVPEYSELSITSATKTHKFIAELAISETQRAKGLMFRKAMPANQGMLFLFDNAQMVIMWMKNTYISLDIVFIDQDGLIVHIAKSTVPESLKYISSQVKVNSVFELNAGVTDQLNIQVGDKINHEFFALRAKKRLKTVPIPE